MSKYPVKKAPAKPAVPHFPMTILCQRMPEGMVIIKGFKNFLTRKEIEAKYGKDVTNIYFASPFNVEKTFEKDGEIGIELFADGGNSDESGVMNIGDVFTGKDFSKVCANIKKCGELLHKIIDFQNNPIREVKL